MRLFFDFQAFFIFLVKKENQVFSFSKNCDTMKKN